MIKGLSHFKLREKNIEEALSHFEAENEIALPNLYRLFIKTFEEKIILPLVNDENYGLRSLYDFGINNYPDIVQLDLIEYESAEDSFDMLFDGIDEIDSNEMFLIGKTPFKEGVFVGISDDLYDKIILYNHTDEVQFKFLADDIFTFVSHFESRPHNRDSEQFKLENLYKNWGDEFWRIRSEDQST